ncbi:MAG: phosphogluconate dehydrogenase (NAD(+)-dependent, decarboxylating) [Nitrososphaeria archaeon]|jgi:6-phosphogluconate dehydrogenase
MELGVVGLGRMGSNIAERLVRSGFRVVGYARHAETVNSVVDKGIVGAYSLEELVQKLNFPRIIWIMIPAGESVDTVIQRLTPMLSKGDILVDGGNSNYKDSIRRASELSEEGINFVDVGTSGGIWGAQEGYCMMVGGQKEVVEHLTPIFKALAPGPDKGWGHVGPNGAGHFVKMVHNGVEYGLMEAFGEGFTILKQKKEFSLDLKQVSEIWRYGSVIRSWLLDLIALALAEDQGLKDIKPYVTDSGEGRWTVFEAIEENVSAPVITISLLQRLRSRDNEDFTDRLIAIMRQQFGGHDVKRSE